MVRFSELYELISGRDLEPQEYNNQNGGVPYITGASNFSRHSLIINRWTIEPKVVSIYGDLLITCKGTIGEIAYNTIGTMHIARQVMAIRSKYISLSYLEVFMSYYAPILSSQAKSMIPGISRDNILNIILPFPPKQEQKRVVDAVNGLCEKMG